MRRRTATFAYLLLVAVTSAALSARGALAQEESGEAEETKTSEASDDPSDEKSDGGGAAAPAETSAERGRELTVGSDELEATVRRPEGWIPVSPGEGALLTLQPAGDKQAQIELRASFPVSPKKKDSFFNSFHSKLKSAGFVKVEEPSEKTYGGKRGRQTKYKGNSEQGEFHLFVWQYYRDRKAWIVAGFFHARRSARHFRSFETFLESLSF